MPEPGRVPQSAEARGGAGLDSTRFRRLERRIRRRIGVRTGLARAWQSLPAIVQIVAAATLGYAIAHYLVGHQVPILAVTVTITTLGFARDARPRRVLESVIGILVGVLLSELLGLLIGRGVWQLAVVLVVVLLVARAFSPSPAFAVSAGAQAVIALLLPIPAGGPLGRTLDALVGGVLALLVTALLPRDPRRAARRDARTLLSVLVESTQSIASALRDGDESAADLALARLRRTQALIDDWTTTLDSAAAIARIAPLLRRHRGELAEQQRLRRSLDLAARSLRLVARRVDFLVRDGRRRRELGDVLGEFAQALVLLREHLEGATTTDAARARLAALAERLAPATVLPHPGVAESAVVVMLRPLVVDLLAATGVDGESARTLLPPLDEAGAGPGSGVGTGRD